MQQLTREFGLAYLCPTPCQLLDPPLRLTVSGELQIGWEEGNLEGELQIGWEAGALEGRQDGVQKLKRKAKG